MFILLALSQLLLIKSFGFFPIAKKNKIYSFEFFNENFKNNGKNIYWYTVQKWWDINY